MKIPRGTCEKCGTAKTLTEHVEPELLLTDPPKQKHVQYEVCGCGSKLVAEYVEVGSDHTQSDS